MVGYRERIERAIAPLLSRGFAITSALETPENFGNTEILLASSAIKLRFISDRGQIFADVARPSSIGWYDLSELLTTLGLRSGAGPWDVAETAVQEFETNEALIDQMLADPVRLSSLRSRR